MSPGDTGRTHDTVRTTLHTKPTWKAAVLQHVPYTTSINDWNGLNLGTCIVAGKVKLGYMHRSRKGEIFRPVAYTFKKICCWPKIDPGRQILQKMKSRNHQHQRNSRREVIASNNSGKHWGGWKGCGTLIAYLHVYTFRIFFTCAHVFLVGT